MAIWKKPGTIKTCQNQFFFSFLLLSFPLKTKLHVSYIYHVSMTKEVKLHYYILCLGQLKGQNPTHKFNRAIRIIMMQVMTIRVQVIDKYICLCN